MPRHNSVASKSKSDDIVLSYISDLKEKNDTESVYVARVTKTLGNARIQVVYSKGHKVYVEQVKIPGRFTGRAKKAMGVSSGSLILIAETGVNGALALEMIAILTREDLTKIQDYSEVHPNIVSLETDAERLTTTLLTATAGDGYEFEARTEEVDIDNV
uniref:S1-like domain-containing protein n=1 Tax=viral metagenome TaxID=1070528 RepID=A0A6C0AI90_9ZZZZ